VRTLHHHPRVFKVQLHLGRLVDFIVQFVSLTLLHDVNVLAGVHDFLLELLEG